MEELEQQIGRAEQVEAEKNSADSQDCSLTLLEQQLVQVVYKSVALKFVQQQRVQTDSGLPAAQRGFPGC